MAVPLVPDLASLWKAIYPGIGRIFLPAGFFVSLMPMMSGLGVCTRVRSFSAPHDVLSELTFMCQIFALLAGRVGERPKKLSNVV